MTGCSVKHSAGRNYIGYSKKSGEKGDSKGNPGPSKKEKPKKNEVGNIKKPLLLWLTH